MAYTFADLQADLTAALGRSDVPAAVYRLLIADLNRRLKVRERISVTTLAAPYTLPADFSEALAVYIAGTPNVVLRPSTTFGMRSDYSTATHAAEYRVTATALELNPATGETVSMDYHTRLADLSAPDDTSLAMAAYPAVFLYGALTMHAQLRRDETGLATWPALYENALNDAMYHDSLARFGGGVMVPKAATA